MNQSAAVSIPFEASPEKYFLNLDIRSGLLEEFFNIPNGTLLRWEESGLIASKKVKVGGRQIRYYDVNNLRTILTQRGAIKKPDEPLIYAVWNNKGGVGKSTLTFEVSLMMSALMGLKVLVIDSDSQSDTTHLFNATDEVPEDASQYEWRPSLYEILEGLANPQNHRPEALEQLYEKTVLHVVPGLDLIASDERLSEIDYDLFSLQKVLFEERDGKKVDITRLGLLDVFIRHIAHKYDVILIDSAPNIGLLNLNILFSATRLLMPTELEAKCIHSIQRVSNRLIEFNKIHDNFAFDRTIVVPNKMNQSVIAATALVRLRDLLKTTLSRTFLSQTVTLDKAIQHHLPVFCYADNSVRWYDKIPIITKRLTNQLWDLCHDMLDLNSPDLLFKLNAGEENGSNG